MCLEVRHSLVQLDGVVLDAAVCLVNLGGHRVDLIDHLLQVVHEGVVPAFDLLIGLVDHRYEYLTVVLDALPECLHVAIHQLAELVDPLIEHLEVGQHCLLNGVFNLLDLGETPGLCAFQELVELATIDGKVGLNDLKTLVDVFLHVFMINQVLLELLSELGTQGLDVLNLLGDFASDLNDLLIDVAREEVCTLGRVMRCIFYILD